MGLAERRGITEYKDKVFPGVKAKIDTAAGFPVEFDVRWDTLEDPYAASNAEKVMGATYFTPLQTALQSIGQDDMGKSALKSALKKVIIDGSAGTSYDSFTFEGGVLTLQHKPGVNEDYVDERTKGLQALLESKL